MSVKRGGASTAEYTVSYPLLGGVDLSEEGRVSRERLAYAENMYRDYDGDGGGVIESIPGYRALANLSGRINSIFVQRAAEGKRYLVIHAADKLYRLLPEDGAVPTLIGSIKDGASRAFCFGYELYVLDGENMIRISEEGVASTVGSEGAMPYVPTTYYNGKPYEARNFLTDECIEKTTLSSIEDYSFGSPGIYYRITDAEARLCATLGADQTLVGNIYIPSYTTIGTERYKVVEIGEETFAGCTGIKTVTVNEGITKIGSLAFCDCTSLTKIFLPETLSSIGSEAFLRCSGLTELYLGSSLAVIGKGAFDGCTSLKRVYYTADSKSFAGIENYEALAQATLTRYDGIKEAHILLPIYGRITEISKVRVGSVSYSYDPIYNGECYTEVLMHVYNRAAVVGQDVEICGKLTRSGGYVGTEPHEESGAEAITHSTVCELFDGRVFLAGNPSTPSTVYWCSPDSTGRVNPLYFGTSSYFADGGSSSAVVELLATSGTLAVFKDEDDGSGSVFYHTPMSTGDNFIPKVYPVSHIHTGICACGRAISFYDDPVFLTRNGLFGIDKLTDGGERPITPRSRYVNRLLLTENLADAGLGRWCGYLVIATGERIYLADSRAAHEGRLGERTYEWYLLSGIGSRGGGERVYRYCSHSVGTAQIHKNVDGVAEALVYSERLSDGSICYYTVEEGERYAVYPTEELSGGVFSPLSAMCTVEERLLIFGTEDGSVMVFNNDKRGVAPDFISSGGEELAAEYSDTHKREIHPSFYSFAGYAPRYAVRLRLDDCDIPHLTKSTVKNSLALKCRVRGRGGLKLEIGTDRTAFEEVCRVPSAAVDFGDLDFSALSLSPKDTVTVSSAEKEKGWVEKQLSIYSDEIACPIGVYSAAFRFTVKGRIKNN